MLTVTPQQTTVHCSILSRGEQKYSDSNELHATETGDKCWPDGSLGTYANYTYVPYVTTICKVQNNTVEGVHEVNTNV